MKKFIIIDFEIESFLGHFFTFADSIAQEACKRGYEVSILTNTEFSKFTKDLNNKNYRVYPIGQIGEGVGEKEKEVRIDKIDSPSLLKKLIKKLKNILIPKKLREVSKLIRYLSRKRRPIRFINGLTKKSISVIDKYFETNSIGPHDIILFSSYRPISKNIYEVLNILNKKEVQSKLMLYFHDGPDERLKAQFKSYLKYYEEFDNLNINYYASTSGIANSYKKYLIKKVKTIPYIDRYFQINKQINKDDKIYSICYVGNSREEKGYNLLPFVINLPTNYLTKVEFIFQSNGRDLASERAFNYLSNIDLENITLLDKELSPIEYIDFLSKADIVLCLYSKNAYNQRVSGVFNEAISHGIPALVSSGTYMHFEIVRAIHHNNLKLKKKVQVIETVNLLKDKKLNKVTSLNFDNLLEHNGVHTLFFNYSYGNNNSFESLEVNVIFYNKRKVCHKIKELLAPGIDTLEGSCLINIPADADKMQVQISNLSKFDKSLLKSLSIDICESKYKLPLSSIAGIVCDKKDIQLKLQDMIDFLQHYRNTCQDFSKDFASKHSVENFLNIAIEDS